jgi:hypothetical protein
LYSELLLHFKVSCDINFDLQDVKWFLQNNTPSSIKKYGLLHYLCNHWCTSFPPHAQWGGQVDINGITIPLLAPPLEGLKDLNLKSLLWDRFQKIALNNNIILYMIKNCFKVLIISIFFSNSHTILRKIILYHFVIVLYV